MNNKIIRTLVLLAICVLGYLCTTFAQVPVGNRMLAVESALEKRDVSTAVELLSQELESNPSNRQAYLMLAGIYDEFEEFGLVVEVCNQALACSDTQKDDFACEILILRGSAYRELGELEQSIVDLTAALNISPKREEILYERGQTYSDMGELDKSDDDYRRAIAISPGYSDAHLGIVSNKILRNRYDDALSYLANMDESIEKCQSFYIIRGVANLSLERLSEAIDDFLCAIEFGWIPELAENLVAIAESDYALVENRIQAKLSKCGSDIGIVFTAAAFYASTGHYTDAIKYYMSALSIDRQSMFASRIAGCYFSLQDWDNAFKYIDMAISIDPEDEYLYTNKAGMLCFVGMLPEALSTMNEGISKNPDAAVQYMQRGLYHSFMGHYHEAIDDYTKCLTILPLATMALMNRAFAYWYAGESDKARADCREIVVKEDKDETSGCIFYAHLLLGDKALAEKELERYLDQNHRSPSSLYEAACFYSLMKDNSASFKYLKDAVQGGYGDMGYIQNDPRLQGARETAEYKTMMGINEREEHAVRDDVPTKNVGGHTRVTYHVPYTDAYGFAKIKGSINGFPATIIYEQSGTVGLEVTRSHVKYLLDNGYILESDVTLNGKAVGKTVPVGASVSIRSLSMGDVRLVNITAKIVGNDHQPVVFGKALFKGASIVKTGGRLSITM